ncbi:MAG: hypothetical protein MZW92_62925 [Comamonadaceae bacterium]|nr:hypothetical protein [Comamonadaceae bacterium]
MSPRSSPPAPRWLAPAAPPPASRWCAGCAGRRTAAQPGAGTAGAAAAQLGARRAAVLPAADRRDRRCAAARPARPTQVILDAARRTRDETLFRRAVEIALQARAGEQALAAARAWRWRGPSRWTRCAASCRSWLR